MNIKKLFYGVLSTTLVISSVAPMYAATEETAVATNISAEETKINLADNGVTVNGDVAATDTEEAVYVSHDIIYYEDKDTYESGNSYGEGKETDKHTAEEADKHTVVNITKPGTYRISGKLSYGQIFVNVGKEEADKVTLIFDNADINCTVAPAVFFYKVYECDGDATTETASNKVDTSNAGARVIIADDSTNNISGSYVARIYKDNADQKKLHKYDGAFYSRMSMEIDGESKGNGVLNIKGENEGLDTELHLTINGGHINIESGDDGINVNEEGISVFTMNDGYLKIFAGNGAEGDGIDSNGWNVINGGTVIALANPKSMDGGIDSDMGSTINGGTVIGAGNMYDPLDDTSEQLYMFLELAQKTDELLVLTDESSNPIFAYDFPYEYSYISLSSPSLKEGNYNVYAGGSITGIEEDGLYTSITSYTKGTQMQHGGTSTSGNKGGKGDGMMLPEGMENMERPERPGGMENMERPEKPDGVENIERPEFPEGMGTLGQGGPHGMQSSGDTQSYTFNLTKDNKGFTNVTSITTTNSQVKTPFTDVSSDSIYAEAVAFCQSKGLMGGTSETTFSPNATMTREMFATILYRLGGNPTLTQTSSFSDVKNTSAYYFNAVSWASQKGITKGVSSDAFGVGQSITLQDAAVMLERYGKGGNLSQVLSQGDSSKPATRAQIALLLMSYCK